MADVLLAFPAILLAILFAAVFQASTLTAMAAIGIALVPVFARVVRGAGLQIMQQDYVTITRTYGANNAWIFLRHLLPNVGNFGADRSGHGRLPRIAILAEAALRFTSASGTPPPDSTSLGSDAERVADLPGPGAAARALAGRRRSRSVVLGFNLLGDGLRDRLDPMVVERGQLCPDATNGTPSAQRSRS